MANILDITPEEVEMPFSILDTDLYKVRPVLHETITGPN